MRSSLALAFAVFSAGIAAQSNYTFPSGFNLGLISSSDKMAWCLAERNTCPPICGGAASSNDCDDTTLVFDCVCSNGTVPDVSLYQNTIPFFVCQANYAQCINNNPNDLQAQAQCKANAQCGTLNATASTDSSSSSATASSTTLSTSASGSATQTGTTTASATAATSKAAAEALKVAQDHSTGLFVAAVLAAFRLIL